MSAAAPTPALQSRDMAVTRAALRKAEEAYRESAAETERLRKRRNKKIREAVSSGAMRAAEVARVTELGRARIAQILAGRER